MTAKWTVSQDHLEEKDDGISSADTGTTVKEVINPEGADVDHESGIYFPCDSLVQANRIAKFLNDNDCQPQLV